MINTAIHCGIISWDLSLHTTVRQVTIGQLRYVLHMRRAVINMQKEWEKLVVVAVVVVIIINNKLIIVMLSIKT